MGQMGNGTWKEGEAVSAKCALKENFLRHPQRAAERSDQRLETYDNLSFFFF